MRLPFVVLALAAALASSTGAVPLSDELAGGAAGAAAALARAPAPLRPSHAARHVASSPTSAPLAGAAAAAPASLGARLLSLLGNERRAAVAGVRRSASPKKHKRGTHAKRCAASSSTASTKSASSTSSAAMTTSTALPPTQNAATRKLVAGGYWADWTAGTLPPESIDFSKFDFINYAFGTPNSDATITFSSGTYSESLLKRLVTAAHNANSKVVLSLGGWGNSGGFSGAVVSDTQRAKFIRNLVAMQAKFALDGFDFDWEYPNNVQGATNRPEDTRNLQTFLVDLRAAVPKGTILSAAVPHQPWLSSAGAPVGSVARAATALDYIVIMNYDVWGGESD
jgi:chitinase